MPLPPLPLGLAAAAAAALLATPAPTQERDWDEAMVKACEHRRYGMRRAVSRKIAEAGDASVPAVRAYAERKGGVPLLIVDAIANADTRGDAVIALLEDWARDRTFYWRAQALGGLARRKLERLRPLYLEAVRDVSHLYRIEGARGLLLLDGQRDRAPIDGLVESDADPRVRIRVASLLAESGDQRFVGVLVGALELNADFLGDPWGKREADRAEKVVRPLLSEGAAVAATADFSSAKRAFAGGLAIRSCRHGDLFLRWTDDGELLAGLLPQGGVRLPESAWSRLRAGLAKLEPDAHRIHGKVICDYLEVVTGQPARRIKCAPGELPGDLGSWLAELADTLRATSTPTLADELTGRLAQFAAPGDK